MTYERSELCCPVCGMQLCKGPVVWDQHPLFGVGVELWCGFGPCASEAANEGATATTELAAFNALDAAVRLERSQREEE